jgi:plasmid replication initiation protein
VPSRTVSRPGRRRAGAARRSKLAGTQVDLFLESLINAPLKDDRALMEFPFFSLQKQPRMEPLVYDDGKVKIEVRPGPKGIATIWDKDLLIYVASLINERLERGMAVERTVTLSAHDYLKLTGRNTSKHDYQRLLEALFRLRSTSIVTTLEAGGEREWTTFGWIDNARVLEREIRTGSRAGEKIMAAVEVTLNQWMFRAIVKDRRVLTINPAYFQLSMGLERRLYELARKHLGQQERWAIALPRLAEKCGSLRELKGFKHDLSKAIERDAIPDYRARLAVPEEALPRERLERTMVEFTARPAPAAPDQGAALPRGGEA